MIQAKAYAAQSSTSPLAPYSFERRDPREHDVVIDVKYCGICHTDIHMARNEWGMSAHYPMVPGHEITGVVSRVGSKVSKFKVGDNVGMSWLVDACRQCANCKEDLEQYCLEGYTFAYGALERDGKSVTQGGYSNIIVANENYIVKIPNSLSLDKAAPLLCSGITPYSALRHWNAGPGKKVAINGLGGLGHMGVKMASALKAEVSILSHSENKRADATNLGAHHFICTQESGVFQKHANTFDLIINTVSSDININDYLGLLKTDGTMVSLGIPGTPYLVSNIPLIMQRRNFAGSSLGSIKEMQQMLEFCAQHNIVPEIEVISPQQINEAYERILKSDVRYRFVVDMTKL